MMEVISHILTTPYLWTSLGTITALAMYIGPLLYNGDLKITTKSVLGIGIFAFFCVLLFTSHVIGVEHVVWPKASQPFIFIALVGMAYSIGLYVGVLIFKYLHR